MKYKVLSLFSGAGGLDLGFKNDHFETVACVEKWDVACLTLKKNKISKRIMNSDIREIDFNKLNNEIGKIDVIIGGPPCPPYSQTRHYLVNKRKGFEDDVAGFGVPEYFRAVAEIKPKIFVFENVDGFSFKTHQNELNFVKETSDNLGYKIQYMVMNSANYGVPQPRKRFILVGISNSVKNFTFPEESHSKSIELGKKQWVTAGEAFLGLKKTTAFELKQKPGAKHFELLKQIPPGQNYLYFTEKRGHPDPQFKWKSRYWTFLLKLSPDRPSWTIQASFSNNQGPFHWDNRFLRIEEIKRLQTFPDDYIFEGEFKDQWKQIGNAVPPLLSEKLAFQVYSALEEG